MLDDIVPIAQAIRGRMSSGTTTFATEEERTALRAVMTDLGVRGTYTDLNGIGRRRVRNGAWR